MTKKLTALLLCLALLCAAAPMALADENPAVAATAAYAPVLTSLTHNCPNTGIMLPEHFDPYVSTYVLTVASWVSRVSFTPVSEDPNATIRVNGTTIRSGKASSYIKMTDEPQAVEITVTNAYGDQMKYTVYLQRRPSERRTRVSAGYIDEIYQKSGKWYISADLVTVSYSDGNMSSFTNTSSYLYKYAVDEHCTYYYGTMGNPIRAYDIGDFYNNYTAYGSTLYRIVYIEDVIVAVLPYDADY